MASYPTSITYNCDGATAAWHVPFPYGSGGDVGAIAISPDGNEKRLVEGRDYILNGSSLIYIGQAGARLTIYLKASAAQAEAGAAARALAAQASPAPDYAPGEAISLASDLEMAEDGAEKILAQATARAAEIMEAADGRAQARLASLDAGIDQELAATREYCENMRKLAFQEARKACQAAASASIHNRRPGIAAVAEEWQIPPASSGLFIINPHVTHAPTPFMGVWPAGKLCDMAWDGFFFIGKPYPENPQPAPVQPLRPEMGPPAQGDAGDWLPCEHVHLSGLAPECGKQCGINSGEL